MELAAKVGLQLLLEPQASSVIFRAACSTTGVIYPVYASFQALENNATRDPATKDKKDDEQWLTYWAVYGLFSLLDQKSDEVLRVVPYYYHVKFGFLMWLMLPQTQGAKVLYQSYLRPTLQRYQPKIDVMIQRSQAVALMMYHLYKVPIDATVSAALFGLAQARAFLIWFIEPGSSEPGDSSKGGKQGGDAKRAAGQFILT